MRLYLSSFRLGIRPEELLRLLNGRNRTAVIFNANDYKTTDERATSLERESGDLHGIGLDPVEIDLRRYFRASDDLRRDLAGFDLFWVPGGNVFILRRALRQSGADALILDTLEKDAVVYGGYSAGAAVLGRSLRGIELVDDPNDVPEGYEPDVVWGCLGILPYNIVPHYKSDHPESLAIENSVRYLIETHEPFIALRDGEVIIREGDKDVIVTPGDIYQATE